MYCTQTRSRAARPLEWRARTDPAAAADGGVSAGA